VTPTPSPEVSGAISALVQGRHQQPHDLLGQHVEGEGLRIRVLKPLASSVRVRFEDGVEIDLEHEAEGVFSAVRADTSHTMDYRVLTTWGDGIEHLGARFLANDLLAAQPRQQGGSAGVRQAF
jgi:1,4-alpha-glucan branching enzyme